MSGLRTPIAFAAIVAAAAMPLGANAADAAQDDGAIAPDAQVVARDPATGQLRAATAEEMQALHRARAAQRAAGRPTSATHTHWNGARGARVTDEMLSYSIVVKTADGKLVELCVEDPSMAAAKSARVQSSTLPTE